jgi:amidase
MGDLVRLDAATVVGMLRTGEITPHDLLDALEERIAAVDGEVNALPTLCFGRAREHAERLARLPVEDRGPLAGLPVPIKDLVDVAGVRSTYGSRVPGEYVPPTSDVLVERLEQRGAVVYAKSNTPEFGAGANTFNDVFGATRNPWNTSRSAAGSSGGAAAALASGTAWVAHGSDMGGSLRNPASFCGVVGLRPSPGRVARTRGARVDANLAQDGPMARNVRDAALLLDAMAGDDPRDPFSLPGPAQGFLAATESRWTPRRVAWSATLGITPVDPEVAAIAESAARRFEDTGANVEDAHPDLSEAHECFQVLRADDFAAGLGGLLPRHRDTLKPEIVWNIDKGLALTTDDVRRAEAQRVELVRRTAEFFEDYDLLVTPATIVAPFPVEERFVTQCAGHTFDNYVEWLAIAYAITLVCCPALSLPCGFTADDLPVGLQIVAPPKAEHRLLAAARALEDVLGLRGVTPIEPRNAPRERTPASPPRP